jgi:hypothetical protein
VIKRVKSSKIMRLIRYATFLSTAFIWLGHGSVRMLAMVPPICDTVCDGSADCNTVCFIDQEAYDNGDPTSCYAYGVYPLPCCGDGICDVTNEMGTCDADCLVIGDYCHDSGIACDPTVANACGSGNVCDSSGCCVAVPNCTSTSNGSCQNPVKPPSPCFDSYCYQSSDCCSGDHCYNNFPVEDWLHGLDYGVCIPNVDVPPSPHQGIELKRQRND